MSPPAKLRQHVRYVNASDDVRLAWAESVSASLAEVRTPTLVLHASGDEVVPIAEGRFLASGIPGAEFVELDSRNHVLLEHEPAWQRFMEEVLAFLEPGRAAGDSPFAALSTRE
jgi:pimeloyl-ACP methyl ester carboxylesterase